MLTKGGSDSLSLKSEDWKLVPQERILVAKRSAIHLRLEILGTTSAVV